MNIDVLVAVIAAVASIVGVVIASVTTTRQANKEVMTKLDKSLSELDKAQSLMKQQLDELTREVRVHNGFAEKIPAQEERIKALERDVKEIKSGAKSK